MSPSFDRDIARVPKGEMFPSMKMPPISPTPKEEFPKLEQETHVPSTKIKDYNQLMRYGLVDKLFFIDKLFNPWKSLVDIGCAEGFYTKMIGHIYPTRNITGYDNDPSMIDRARYSGEALNNVKFTTDPRNVIWQHVAFVSSTIHEVYSYNTDVDEIKEFWNTVFSPDREIVCVRDMAFQGLSYNITGSNWLALDRLKEYCDTTGTQGDLKRFEERFGSITQMKNFAHYLLKYLYTGSPNWDREVMENYLPLTLNDLKRNVPEGWKIQYEEAYQLPFLKHRWAQDFGSDLTLPFTTHCKLIIVRQ